MATSNITDEFQIQPDQEEKHVTVEEAALSSSAMSNAFVGQDELNSNAKTESDDNNSEFKYRTNLDDYNLHEHDRPPAGEVSAEVSGRMLTKDQLLAREVANAKYQRIEKKYQNSVYGELNDRRESDRERKYIEKIFAGRPSEEVSKQELDNARRDYRRIFATHKGDDDYSDTTIRKLMRDDKIAVGKPTTTLSDEKLRDGKQGRIQPPKLRSILEQQPPGANMPGIIQGTANYAPKSMPRRFPTDTQVTADIRRNTPAREMISRAEAGARLQDTYFQLSELGALGDALIDGWGGVDAYSATLHELIKAGNLPADIIQNAKKDFFGKTYSPDDDMATNIEETLDEDKFRARFGKDVEPATLEEMLGYAREIVADGPNNRSGNRMDFPDVAGAPLSSSTGTNTDGKYDDPDRGNISSSSFNPENEDSTYRTDGGGRGGGGGGGGGGRGGNPLPPAFQAMQNLHNMAPSVAAMMMNSSIRPLIIKRTVIPSMYPPRPKHTNLNIVQQSIARFNEDSSLLNVYFS